MIKMVIAHQSAVGLAARGTEFILVKLSEKGTLVPSGSFKLFECFVEVFLGDVEHANLQHLVGLSVVDEVMEPAPGAFQRLEIFVVHDEIDLLGELLINLSDHGRYGLGDIGGDERRGAQGHFGQRSDGALNGGLLFDVASPEFLVQQRVKFIDLCWRGGGACALGGGFRRYHKCSSIRLLGRLFFGCGRGSH